jgi:hypothetical protein
MTGASCRRGPAVVVEAAEAGAEADLGEVAVEAVAVVVRASPTRCRPPSGTSAQMPSAAKAARVVGVAAAAEARAVVPVAGATRAVGAVHVGHDQWRHPNPAARHLALSPAG